MGKWVFLEKVGFLAIFREGMTWENFWLVREDEGEAIVVLECCRR